MSVLSTLQLAFISLSGLWTKEERRDDVKIYAWRMAEISRDLARHLIAAGFEEPRRPGVITPAGLQLVSELAKCNGLPDWAVVDNPDEFGRLRDIVIEHLKRQQLLP